MTEADGGSDVGAERIDPKKPLEVYDWDDLVGRFNKKMEECQAAENEIYTEFNTLLAVSVRWGVLSIVRR